MRKLVVFALTLLSVQGFAQFTENLEFNLILAPGTTIANIKDELPQSSSQSIAADGNTYIDKNGLKASTIKLGMYKNMSETWAVGTGFVFNKIRLNPRNDDGSYIGTSVYYVNYVSIPLLLRFRSNEVADNLRITGAFGPSVDFKTNEEAKGADYSHFMVFANNRYDIDPDRGRNGNNKSMNLFGGVAFSLHLNVGVEYSFSDNVYVQGGFGYQYRLSNLLNSRLTYNDVDKTSITDVLVFRAHTFSFEFGVGYRLN